ncbi:MAG: ATP-binding protein [Clostridia bacterium]|nr:ATP-binding protein [Clostridia bacterium]
MFRETKVYAFVGPSGTGKSYRAQMVANKYNIKYIIDDGILIKDSDIVAGSSAKKASTKIETVKKALFIHEGQRNEMRRAIRRMHPESILILGTSDDMVRKIAQNLKLPKITKIIYIKDVATDEEIEDARRSRIQEGKHVIPVPTFEIKKDFSGYLLDPLQIFKTGIDKTPYISEKSIIRPTFSYIGNFTISDAVFREIIEYLSTKTNSVTEVLRVMVKKTEAGPSIYIEVEIKFGVEINSELRKFKEKCIKEIERQTSMNVVNMKIIAKKIKLPNSINLDLY